MAKKDLLVEISDLIAPICKKENVILFDLAYVKEGPFKYLRVYIDNEKGITIEDCQRISEQVSRKLDEKDPISENYFLEVSSPGIDRPFKEDKDYEKNLNESVEVRLYQSVNGLKQFEAVLVEFHEDSIVLMNDKKEMIKIEKKNIVRINKAVKF